VSSLRLPLFPSLAPGRRGLARCSRPLRSADFSLPDRFQFRSVRAFRPLSSPCDFSLSLSLSRARARSTVHKSNRGLFAPFRQHRAKIRESCSGNYRNLISFAEKRERERERERWDCTRETVVGFGNTGQLEIDPLFLPKNAESGDARGQIKERRRVPRVPSIGTQDSLSLSRGPITSTLDEARSRIPGDLRFYSPIYHPVLS